MKKNLHLTLFLFLVLSPLFSQNVEISGNKFQVNGNDIFFNAISGPWQWRSDCDINFMRRNFDWNYWNSEFQRYADNHINLVRIWLHGSGSYSPAINSDSYVDAYGSGDQFWQDMDALAELAETYGVYIMPVFWSFDMVKEGMSSYYQNYRTLIQDDNRMGSYIDNFLIPFLQRYESNPWIMGYDLVNEPEHMWRDADCGNLNPYWVMRFFARCAAAVNANSSKPVTIGSMWVVYNSPNFGSPDGDSEAGWNRYTDASLQSYYDNPNAYLDFYSPHWYQWQNTSGPYERTVYEWLGSDDKPVIIGETYGGDLPGVFGSLTDYYMNAYYNGFDGVIGWKNACENDGYGTWAGIAPAVNAFYNAYPHLVYPEVNTTSCNEISLPGRIEAENYCNMNGIQTEETSDAGGGLNVGWIDPGDWLSYKVNIAVAGTYTISYRVASESNGGSIRIEQGGGSPVFGTIDVPATGGWQQWATISHNVELPAGSYDLAIYTGTGGFNLNWIDVMGVNQPGNENIAFNKPVYSSSVESTDHPASNVVDADGTTRWSSSYEDPQWIYVDLQQEYSVSRVKLDWEAAYAKQFQIQISSDNQTWTTVYSNYNYPGGVTDVSLNETARYIKVYGWERATEWGYSLYEFEVYGSPANLKSSVTQISGSEAQKHNTFLVGPNPADESITIKGIEGVEVVRLLDLSGNIILEKKKGKDHGDLKLFSGTVPDGVYLIIAGNKVKKILIRH